MILALMIYMVFTFIPTMKMLAVGLVWCYALFVGLGLTFGKMNIDVNGNASLFNSVKEKVLTKWKVVALILVTGCLLPSKEVTAYMIAGYGVEQLVQNEAVQEIGSDGLDIIKKMMEKAKQDIENKGK